MLFKRSQFRRVLRHAWRYGHFENPEHREAWSVKESDLARLEPADAEARSAIASLQMSDIQMESLVGMEHLRPLIADGDVGPATLKLIEIKRCRVKDHFGREPLTYRDVMQGSGRWGACDPTSDADHSIRIKFDDRRATSTWRGYLEKVLRNAERCSAEVGLAVRHLKWNTMEDYESSCAFRYISGGTIGYYYLPGAG